MNRRTFLRTLGFGLAACSTSGFSSLWAGVGSSPLPRPRNIVLILGDDIGYGDLSCYGKTPNLTPFIDEYVKGGVRFTDAHAPASTCTPTRYAIFTGQYAWRKAGTGIAPGDAAPLIPASCMTLQRLMQRSGMVTGAIGKWHLGMGSGPGKTNWNKPISPSANDTGFDYTFLMAATADRVPCVYVENGMVVGLDPNDPIEVNYKHNYPGEPDGKRDRATLKLDWAIGHNQAVVNGIGRIGYMKGGHRARWKDEDMADVFTEKACAFMKQNQDRPFFLYLGTNDIHEPRVPHPRFAGKSPYGAYGDVLRQFDDTVRRVVGKLRALGLERETLVIISSDNGPRVFEGYKDGSLERIGTHSPSGGFRGGKYTPYEGGHRVPFIASWPGAIPPGGESNALVSLVDLAATFAALRGMSLPEDAFPDSFDQSAALLNLPKPHTRNSLICQDSRLSLREGAWKYIPATPKNTVHPTDNPLDGELYNLDADPQERTNLVRQKPHRAKAMHATLLKAQIEGRTRPHFPSNAFHDAQK